VLLVEGRMVWNERCARLKLALPAEGSLVYDMPGNTVTREAEGQVPGGRWVTRSMDAHSRGLASDVLSDFDATREDLCVTLARASRYACDPTYHQEEKVWKPVVDCGELKFRLALFGGDVDPEAAAQSLLFPPVAAIAAAQRGAWPRQGSLGRVTPRHIQVLSIEKTSATQLRPATVPLCVPKVPAIARLCRAPQSRAGTGS